MYNFDPYNVLLAITTNIPVLLMTAFVLQDHIWQSIFIAGPLPLTRAISVLRIVFVIQ